MISINKNVILLLLSSTSLFALSKDVKKDEILICVRWSWTGDVVERKVYCKEWAKKDCSNRLHKGICKLEGAKI